MFEQTKFRFSVTPEKVRLFVDDKLVAVHIFPTIEERSCVNGLDVECEMLMDIHMQLKIRGIPFDNQKLTEEYLKALPGR